MLVGAWKTLPAAVAMAGSASMRALAKVGCVAIVGLGLAAQDDAVRIDVLPGPVQLEWNPAATDWWYAGRVVDAVTHEGLPGAVLYSVPERNLPVGGEFWFAAKFVADEFGFVRMPAGSGRGWFVYEAPGHGAASSSSCPYEENDMVQLLMPGLPWRVAVRDAFDRPVADAEVGYCVGCGHTPDVRVARTDREGIAVLPDCEPTGMSVDSGNDLYVRAPGISPEYASHRWQLGDAPTLVRLSFAVHATGEVLAPDGKPLAGAILRADYGLHRGPYAWSGADGSFRLDTDGRAFGLGFGGLSFRVRLPATRDDVVVRIPASTQMPPPPRTTLDVLVRDAGSGAPLADVDVEAWQIGIGSDDDLRATTDARGRCSLEVPVGPLGVTALPPADRDELPTYDQAMADLEIGPAGVPELVLALRLRPTASVACEPNASVTLVTRRGSVCVDGYLAAGRRIPVPNGEAFAFAVSPFVDGYGSLLRWFRFDSPPREPVQLRAWRPTRVRLQLVDQDRMPVAATVSITGSHEVHQPDAPDADEVEASEPTESPSGGFEIDTWIPGCAWLSVVPRDGAHRPFLVHLALPTLGDDRLVDLGTLVAPRLEAPLLRVLHADGSPVVGSMQLLRPGLVVQGDLAEDGGWNGMLPSAGDRVTVRAEERVPDEPPAVPISTIPITTRLVGNGPWVLQQGRGTIRFEACDDRGLRLDGGQILFGITNHAIADVRELRGLPAGDHEFFVGAVGCHGVCVRVRLGDGERREVRLVLPRVPR